MKPCQKCGYENEDEAKFCMSCGNNLENVSQEHTLDFNPDQDDTKQQQINNETSELQKSQPINYQQEYTNQEGTYQQTNYPTKTKNVWIAVILDIIGALILYFLSGIGQLYLGLYKRGIVICLAGLLVSIINIVIVLIRDDILGSLLTLIIGLGLMIYSAYDAYLCTNAINEARPLPLLFGVLDIE